MHNKDNIICYLFLYDIKIERVNINYFFFFLNHHTPLTRHLIRLSIVDGKIFIGIPALYRAAPGEVHEESHDLQKTAPAKEDLHVVVSQVSVTR